MKVNLKRN